METYHILAREKENKHLKSLNFYLLSFDYFIKKSLSFKLRLFYFQDFILAEIKIIDHLYNSFEKPLLLNPHFHKENRLENI